METAIGVVRKGWQRRHEDGDWGGMERAAAVAIGEARGAL